MKATEKKIPLSSHPSVLALLTEGQPGEKPADIIRRKARAMVKEALDLRWEGPPFKPQTLAGLQGIEIVSVSEAIGSEARIYPKPDGTIRIDYDKSYPPSRVNFSICHELVHTLFPDCYEMVRCRKESSIKEKNHKEFEDLCDIGAAELLMPMDHFKDDLYKRGESLETLVELADLYTASIEAVMIRAAQFSRTAFIAVVLSEKFKPSEQRSVKNSPLGFVGTSFRPKLRVDYAITSNRSDVFIPKDKSAPDASVAYAALKNSQITECYEEWSIPNFGRRRIQAVALPKVDGVNRVGLFIYLE